MLSNLYKCHDYVQDGLSSDATIENILLSDLSLVYNTGLNTNMFQSCHIQNWFTSLYFTPKPCLLSDLPAPHCDRAYDGGDSPLDNTNTGTSPVHLSRVPKIYKQTINVCHFLLWTIFGPWKGIHLSLFTF